MRLYSGKRIGQSGLELGLTVFFSFIIHVIFLFAALFLYVRTVPKTYIPAVYDVKLVELREEAPVAEIRPVPPAPKRERPITPRPDTVMPELKKIPPPQKKAEPEKVLPKPEAPAEAVTVQAVPAFKFPWYLSIVSDKIRRNWNPPPGATGLRARVVFRIYRSGVIIEPRLEQASGNFYFDQAAMRAILMSSPFPPLPEGFGRESVDISVDLEPKE